MFEEITGALEEERKKIEQIKTALKVEELKKGIGKLQLESSNPHLWESPEEAKRLLQQLKSMENQVENFERIKTKLEDLFLLAKEASKEADLAFEKELGKELGVLRGEIKALELVTFLSGPYDQNNAILCINAGAGGTDAQDWAQILLRMYTRYAENKGWGVELPEISYGEEAGIKSATLVISAPYAYGYLKSESGVHRLVRISPFSAEGKRHTSFVSVDVIPETSEEVKVEINPADLRIDTYRASGPGGQHVNKTDSAVRITHLPTKLVAQSQSSRSQHANREAALKLLKSRLYEMLQKEQKQKIEELRGEKKDIAWGHQIRSYVFHPYTLVKDHRTGLELGDVQKVIDGDLDAFIEGYLKGGGKSA